ncbi:MAG: DMT family transporter [Oscillospiraceae bacterium]
MSKTKGTILTILSAIIFGSTAVICKFILAGGSNYAMLTFSRMFIALPFLYIILKFNKVSLKLTKGEARNIFVLCLFGSLATTLSLYASYEYVSVGIATTIHFIYPSLVYLVSILIFKEKVTKTKVLAIVLSTLGVCMFFEGTITPTAFLGIGLAVLSGITYCFYMVYMSRSGLSEMFPFKLSFYICTTNATLMFIYAMATGNLIFNLPLRVWGMKAVVSLCTSIMGISFLQIGIKHIGASNAAIFSLFEPISGVVLGVLILKESCNVRTLVGCVLILVAVAILSAPQRKTIETAEKTVEKTVETVV